MLAGEVQVFARQHYALTARAQQPARMRAEQLRSHSEHSDGTAFRHRVTLPDGPYMRIERTTLSSRGLQLVVKILEVANACSLHLTAPVSVLVKRIWTAACLIYRQASYTAFLATR